MAFIPEKTADELDADEAEDGLPPDRRRARMKDVLRLEARVLALAGEVALLRTVAEASRKRMTREQFAGCIMPAFAANGTKAAFIRDLTEMAWTQYEAFCDNAPKTSAVAPATKAPEPRAPIGPASGLAILPDSPATLGAQAGA